jgi:hypothetical protein
MATLTPGWAIFYRDYGAFDFSNIDIHSLHPMGAKLPSICGESYDGAQARLAASKV